MPPIFFKEQTKAVAQIDELLEKCVLEIERLLSDVKISPEERKNKVFDQLKLVQKALEARVRTDKSYSAILSKINAAVAGTEIPKNTKELMSELKLAVHALKLESILAAVDALEFKLKSILADDKITDDKRAENVKECTEKIKDCVQGIYKQLKLIQGVLTELVRTDKSYSGFLLTVNSTINRMINELDDLQYHDKNGVPLSINSIISELKGEEPQEKKEEKMREPEKENGFLNSKNTFDLSFNQIVDKVTKEISKHSDRSEEEIRVFVEASLRVYLNATSASEISKNYFVLLNADWDKDENRFFVIDVGRLVKGNEEFVIYAEECRLGKNGIGTGSGSDKTPQGLMYFGKTHDNNSGVWQRGAWELPGLENSEQMDDDPRGKSTSGRANNSNNPDRGIVFHPVPSTQNTTNGCIGLVDDNMEKLKGDNGSTVKRRVSKIVGDGEGNGIANLGDKVGVYVYTKKYLNPKFDYVPNEGFEKKILEVGDYFYN